MAEQSHALIAAFRMRWYLDNVGKRLLRDAIADAVDPAQKKFLVGDEQREYAKRILAELGSGEPADGPIRPVAGS